MRLIISFLAFFFLMLSLYDIAAHAEDNFDDNQISYTYKNPRFPEDIFTFEQKQNGAVILYYFGVIYMFLALGIVCAKFFEPSLNVFAEKFSISDELVIGIRAPELLVSFVCLFAAFDDNYIGVVVGSAAFSTFFAVGLCALFAKPQLSLTSWPLIRNAAFNSITLLMLIYFLRDSKIYWWEALVLIIIYILYATFMCLKQAEKVGDIEQDVNTANNLEVSDARVDKEEETKKSLVAWPSKPKDQIIYLLIAPIIFPLWLTLPDVRKFHGLKFFFFFLITIIISILWIASFSYLMVWWSNVVGEVKQIPPEIMGLRFLAVGISIPFLITSFKAARKNNGSMIVTNSISRNIFNITIGLPVPWLFYSLIYGEPVELYSEAMPCTITTLFFVMLLCVSLIACLRWKINIAMGILMIIFYFIFNGISTAFEYAYIRCPI